MGKHTLVVHSSFSGYPFSTETITMQISQTYDRNKKQKRIETAESRYITS